MESNPRISQAEQETEFLERPIDTAENAYLDQRGFTCTPNGSFWDSEDNYFNRNGYDKHNGRYDEYGVYIPGPGWNEDWFCYQNEMGKGEEFKANIVENVTNGWIEEYDKINRFIQDNPGMDESDFPDDVDMEGSDCDKSNYNDYSDAQLNSIFCSTMHPSESHLHRSDGNKIQSESKTMNAIQTSDIPDNIGNQNNVNV